MGFLMRRPHIPVVLAVALLVAACGSLKLRSPLVSNGIDWPAYGGGESRAGIAATRVTRPLVEDWEYDVTAGIGSGSPVVIDSILLVANLRGELYALDAVSGRKLGRYAFSDPIEGSPAAARNLVLLGLTGSPGVLLGYDVLEGAILWRKSYGDIQGTPLVLHRHAIAGTLQGALVCVETSTGELLWKFDLPENSSYKGIRSSPAAESGIVVFGADDGALYGVDAESGTQRWKVLFGTPVAASPAIAHGIVVAADLRGMTRAASVRDGKVLWQFAAGAPCYAPPLVTDSLAIVATIQGSIHAVALSDGSLRWTSAVGAPVNAGAVVSGDYMYLGTLQREVIALRIATGEVAWRTSVTGRIKTAPAIACGRLFVATDDRLIMAFREAGK
jgi:outer membrane protein assembly factor BamB